MQKSSASCQKDERDSLIRRKIVKALRKFRVLHRWMGIGLALFLLISAVTGILLSLKKNFDILQPPTQKGQSTDMSTWSSLEELKLAAYDAAQKHDPAVQNEIDRMDVRPQKGIVKVIFKEENLEIQLDGVSKEVLSIAPRHADWIESLHDGSIISDLFKLISMNALGFGLILMVCSGLWLWIGPKRVRKLRKKRT